MFCCFSEGENVTHRQETIGEKNDEKHFSYFTDKETKKANHIWEDPSLSKGHSVLSGKDLEKKVLSF